MKNLYESILDDTEDLLSGADTAAELAVGRDWIIAHGGQTTRVPKPGQDDKTIDLQMNSEITITKNDTEDSIPQYIPTMTFCHKLYVKGYLGRTIPERVMPMAADLIVIDNCPNLQELPKCPEEVDTFSVARCPKIKSLEGCPKKVKKMFRAIYCGKEFEWKDIKKACPGIRRQDAIY